ncbi:MAG TPA: hypothetical protein VIT68_01245 [Candidatus Gracilibacteria bacterium]
MQIELCGSDVGICALGRALSKSDQTLSIHFLKQKTQQSLSEEDFWELGISHILREITRFGRIGIFYDHGSETLPQTIINLAAQKPYQPQAQKRAEKVALIKSFPTQILKNMALEGWGSSVEFRRIARPFLRQAKNHHLDTIFFPESIFAEASTQKTLQHLAGTQLKVITLADIATLKPLEDSKTETPDKASLGFDKKFTDFEIQRAAQILQIKLPKNLERI